MNLRISVTFVAKSQGTKLTRDSTFTHTKLISPDHHHSKQAKHLGRKNNYQVAVQWIPTATAVPNLTLGATDSEELTN